MKERKKIYKFKQPGIPGIRNAVEPVGISPGDPSNEPLAFPRNGTWCLTLGMRAQGGFLDRHNESEAAEAKTTKLLSLRLERQRPGNL
jgi:hypothetical protein